MKQYTHFHPVYGKLKFIRIAGVNNTFAFFNKENGETRLIKISEVEVYKPNNLTNIPYTLPIPMYSGTY
jgi:hypothetical protein